MRPHFFLLTALLLALAPAAAAQLRISDITVPDAPRATRGATVTIPLAVTVANDGSPRRAFVSAHIASRGIDTEPVSTADRIPTGSQASLSVPVTVDLTGRLPSGLEALEVEVRAAGSRGRVNDAHTITLPIVDAPDPVVYSPSVAEGSATPIATPAGDAVSRLSLTVTTGDDDLRASGSRLHVRVLDVSGLDITDGFNCVNRRCDGPLPARSAVAATVPLTRSVPVDHIGRIVLTLHQSAHGDVGHTSDNWDLERIVVHAGDADGPVLFEREGRVDRLSANDPTFTATLRSAVPPPPGTLSHLVVRLTTEGDDLADQSYLRLEIVGEGGEALSGRISARETGGAPWEDGHTATVVVPLTRLTRPQELGVLALSLGQVSFLGADDWDLGRIEVLASPQGPAFLDTRGRRMSGADRLEVPFR